MIYSYRFCKFHPGMRISLPFVKKFYKANAMQDFQKQHVKNGGVWLSIVSSAPGKQGELSEEEALQALDPHSIHTG